MFFCQKELNELKKKTGVLKSRKFRVNSKKENYRLSDIVM